MTKAMDAPGTNQADHRYPACVITHQTLRRGLAVLLSGALLVLVAPAAAQADTPDGWATAPEVSGFEYLLVLVLIPAGLALVIAVLAALPSIIGEDKGYQPGRAWGGEPAWFGGPKEGTGAADKAEAEAGTGSTSARW